MKDVLERLVADNTTRGIQLTVSDETIVVGTKGQSDDPLTRGTRMPIFSASKPVTAVAFHILVERARVLYSDSVASVIDEFAANNKSAVTFLHLLTHQAGIPDFYMRWVPVETFADWDAAIAAICNLPLDTWPGQQAAYHPLTASALLAEAVRRLDGRPFATFCAEEIFGPLGMTHTTWGLPDELLGEASIPSGSDAMANWFDHPVRGSVVPGGGLWSTSTDLAAFYAGLERILSPATVEFITRRHGPTGTPSNSGIGLGFAVGADPSGVCERGNLASEQSFGHSGAGCATAWRDRTSGIVCAQLYSTFLAQRDRICNLVSDAVHVRR